MFIFSSELRTTVTQILGVGLILTIYASLPSNGSTVSSPVQGASPSPPIHQLAGCSNPNTRKPTNDWGPATSSPVYLPVRETTQLIGSPSYATNSVFWSSRENAPGQSVTLAGAFTTSAKTVKVAWIRPGTVNWQSVVQRSTRSVPTRQQGTTGLSFVVPSDFAPGVYGYEIDDTSAAPPLLGLANAPSLSWAIGIPALRDATNALQSGVHDCAVEQGEVLRLFGKNFFPTSQVVVESSTGSLITRFGDFEN